jgi:hypothetical protein
MKANQKQLKLIQYGLRPSTVTNLSESQVNSLFRRLTESKGDKCGCGCDKETCTCGPDCKKCDCGRQKKETKEQTQVVTQVYDTKKPEDVANLNQALKNPSSLQGKNVQVKETEMTEDMDAQMDWVMKGKTQDPVQTGPTGDGDPNSIQEKEIMEKFESKKQQKYFFAKCGDGKTKEQKKWCKMAEEFADKTNFKKLPEKKKEETKESGMSNFTKKVASAYAGGLASKLNSNLINPTFTESEIEKQIMRIVEKHISPKMTKKDFINLVKEQGTKTAPARPGVKPDVDTPSRPSKPATPYKPKPGVKPAPKAKKEIPTWLTFNELGIKLQD